ncbi:K(+)-transporting ATPase subunit C [Niabella sp. CJ426]|uniref:K(+)-transporting ATPase subunit C n=1 Tax=Niabella sp. CJ426 TaxID=3393740 RepID=UPI003D05A6ED
MKENIMPAIRLTLVCLVFFCGIYTLIVLGLAQVTPGKGGGETINENGKKYYANVGQKFTEDQYFWSRPSAVDYNAAGAAGSNKGPSNPDYLKTVQQRIDTFLVHNPGIQKEDIPSDLVTASGSGLDPHISVQAARIQIKRIAAIRGINESRVQQLVIQSIEKPLLGLLGTERINVLKLNIALDQLK